MEDDGEERAPFEDAPGGQQAMEWEEVVDARMKMTRRHTNEATAFRILKTWS